MSNYRVEQTMQHQITTLELAVDTWKHTAREHRLKAEQRGHCEMERRFAEVLANVDAQIAEAQSTATEVTDAVG